MTLSFLILHARPNAFSMNSSLLILILFLSRVPLIADMYVFMVEDLSQFSIKNRQRG